ncbi:hypothetical protein [Methylobacterium nigriterrae]|uniref:hypothetical protein n=1 Tax=Methylobacterium nigriterrae TaxID=3127512 RepID=UPI003013DC08
MLAGTVGLQSLSAFGAMTALTERTIAVDDAARGARDAFGAGDQILQRVLAMTDFVEPRKVETEFSRAAARLAADLERLKAAAASEAMETLARKTGAAAAEWRADAEILLGIRNAAAIPTSERLGRHSVTLRRH